MSLLKEILEYLEFLQLSGIQDIFFKSPIQTDTDMSNAQDELKNTDLEILKERYKNCKKCSLWKGRIKFVYGEGNPKADIMIIGEAPGANENIQGKPFVGRAGQLLTKMLAAINIARKDVYITNTVKCRPPNNRNPLTEEIAACRPYLEEQISIIKPKYFLILGRVAANTMLKLNIPMKEYRKKVYELYGAKVYVTYHPSALLRTPAWKKLAWEDLKRFRDDYFNRKENR